ncbi:hypothetical protein LEP1GSC137_4566 [Leptospira borgpetersenii str. Noumea 25]|nr:hypothetical protein LEP1GSC137_4566 [Leptospira borgpetersenii str. Noumea 25]
MRSRPNSQGNSKTFSTNKTEILRVNLLYGERNHLYGLNLGLVNLESVSEP